MIQVSLTFVSSLVGPLLSLFSLKSPLDVAYIYSTFTIFLGCFSIVLGKFNLSLKKSLIFGLLIQILSIFLICFFQSFYVMLLSQIIASLGVSLSEPAFYSLISKKSKSYSFWLKIDGIDSIVEGLSILFVIFLSYLISVKIIPLISTLISISAIYNMKKVKIA